MTNETATDLAWPTTTGSVVTAAVADGYFTSNELSDTGVYLFARHVDGSWLSLAHEVGGVFTEWTQGELTLTSVEYIA